MSVDYSDIDHKTQDLKKLKKKLVDQFKEKHLEIAIWLEERGVNIESLGNFSQNIAISMVLILGVVAGQIKKPGLEFSLLSRSKDVISIDSEKLRKLSVEEKRAVDVWRKYELQILEKSEKYDLDPKLIFATIMVESGGNTKAVRQEPQINDASYGLGQLLYSTARLIGFEGTPQDLYDPSENIELIARYHRRNLEVYGDLNVDQIATAYNAGSPYSTATYGHVNKFKKWFNVIGQIFHESHLVKDQETISHIGQKA